MLASPSLYERGPYRVAAAAPGVEMPLAFRVLDSAGACLHHALSLDEARLWIDDRVEAAQRAAPGVVAAFLHRR